ncbi:hypothetical protein Bca101_059030 [Brassica carinata]
MCIDENANGVGAEVANIDQAFEYAQSVSKENGDNDDDSFDGDSPVYVEDVVDTSRAAHIENGGDDDDGGYDYAPAA